MGFDLNADKSEGSVKVFELSGDAFKIGHQHGLKAREGIDCYVDGFYSGFASRNCPTEKVLKEAIKYLPFVEDFSPEIADEIKGIAEGSGRKLEEILMIVANYELFDPWSSARACTAFAVSGQATKSGDAYIGQNWDREFTWDTTKYPILLRVKQSSGPSIVGWTYPGIPLSIGVNSNGVAMCWQTLRYEEKKLGVPTYVVLAEILRQKSIGEALGALTRANRAESFNVMISGENEVYNVEATPSDLDIMYVDKYLGHANNFLSKKFDAKDLWRFDPDTIIRSNRMNKLLGENYGAIEPKTLMNFLRDHVNYPSSICRHIYLDTEGENSVLASFVMVPTQKEMWFAPGNPCKSKFQRQAVK